jgi:outer membrane lipoprotein
MTMRRALCILGFFAAIGLSGCAGGISSRLKAEVTYQGPFSAVQADPHKFVGEVVMLGGKILQTEPGSSEMTVLELPLDSRDRPENVDRSEGRFMVLSSWFLDPAIYREGTLVTVVGRVTGKRVRPIGDYDYVYPVIDPMDIKIWPKPETGYPHVQFGIGFGTSF